MVPLCGPSPSFEGSEVVIAWSGAVVPDAIEEIRSMGSWVSFTVRECEGVTEVVEKHEPDRVHRVVAFLSMQASIFVVVVARRR